MASLQNIYARQHNPERLTRMWWVGVHSPIAKLAAVALPLPRVYFL